MPKRTLRLAELFKMELTGWLSRNPGGRLHGLLTITAVTVSPDLEHCVVHYSVFGSEADKITTGEALERMAPQARHFLGKLRLKKIPVVLFRYDDTPAQAAKVEEIFNRINAEEKPQNDKA